MNPPVSLAFSGRTAIVTGSGQNIGRAMALSLAAQGANVVINGHQDRAAVDAVVEEIKASSGQAMGFMADVSQDHEVAEMVKATVARYGSIDIAVSNVGIRRKQAFLDITPEDWDSVMQTNLTPAFYLARHVIPHMQANNLRNEFQDDPRLRWFLGASDRASTQHHSQSRIAWSCNGTCA